MEKNICYIKAKPDSLNNSGVIGSNMVIKQYWFTLKNKVLHHSFRYTSLLYLPRPHQQTQEIQNS